MGATTVESLGATQLFTARRLAQFLTDQGLIKEQE